jgi:amino acid adenylation domain-containing protein
LWDVDGNEYVDLTCGFGSNFFGYSAPFIVKAIEEQLTKGYEIGPQHPLSGEVSKLFCEMTGLDRAAFCNTGSEAVLGAMRLARTVTGRKMIAMFTGDYHGICDEVIVRGTPSLRSVPAAPGIPPSSVENVLVLDYGDEKSLEILRARADELAAIMVEPVQSRRPDLQPREFLHACRKIADDCGAAFIVDEVITGFRVHPRGAQGIFDIKADIATYGKVVGGGMPIGVIGGVRRFMDALDGGHWQFGDASFPEVGVTYFAGTFVRHPLTMAAAKASLLYLKEQGPELQAERNRKTAELVAAVNAFSAERGASLKLKNFGSLYKITFTRDEAFSDLFHTWLRNKGLHAWDARPCFLTVAHTDEDVAFIVRCLKETVEEMQAAELLSQAAVPMIKTDADGIITVPTTEAQREIWAAVQMNPKATLAYNESVSLRLKGVLNCMALEQAVQRVFDRHEALRGTFSRDGLSMRIHPSVKAGIQLIDLSNAEPSALQAVLSNEADTPFDLEEGPVARILLAGLKSDEYQLIITAHHLVCDGWSIDVLVRDIGSVYSALVDDTKLSLPPADRFAEYAGMEPEWLRSPESREAEAYWLKQFEGEVPVMNMPVDRPRTPVKTFDGAREDFRLDPELTARLKKVGQSCGCTFVNLLLAAFKVFVYRHTGQTDLVIGLPSAGQSVRDCENLVGHCVNLMPLRSQLDPQMPFADYLQQLRRVMLDAFDHQYFTFGTLVKKLNLPRDPSRIPLVPLVFNIDNGIDLSTIRYAGMKFEFISNPRHYENFEIFLNVMDLPDGRTAMEWSYSTGLFDVKTIRRYMAEFETLLTGIAENPGTALSSLPLIPAEEQKLLTETWNHTATDYPRNACIHTLFEELAATAPEAPAVQAADSAAVSYGELNRRANRVANQLRKLGVKEGDCVGLCFERSVEMTVSLLGILKAGGAYVPLDTAYPADRLAHMMKDTAMRIVLCQSGLESALPDFSGRKIGLDEKALSGEDDKNSPNKSSAQSPAYVMYTSGSTGQPKGVVIPHRGVVRLVRNTNYVRLDAKTCTLHFAPIAFDASTFELWAALLNGGRVVLYPPQAPSLEELGRIIRDSGVNTLWLTADLFRAMVSERLDDLRGVKQLLAGGDVLSVPEVKRVLSELRGCCLINGYGPTENTTFTCCCPLHNPDEFCGSVPIGRPIAHTTVYILDELMRPVPVGVTGELYTGGDGLALGYLNQPELTRNAFVPNPFSSEPGARLYRTGDRARWLSDGRVEFQGRQDRQVKVRGFRIELDGIEHVLSQHEALTQIAVTAPEVQPGRRALAAYYAVAQGRQVSREELRSYLGSRLPDYMIPQYCMEMDQLPLSSTGKISRKSLPVPDTGMHAGCSEFTAPRTPEETALAEIWCSVLGIEKVSVCDNFFDLGGHSLLAIQLIDRLGEAGYDVRVDQLFQFPTIEEMTQVIDSRYAVESQDTRWSSLVTLRRGRPGKTPLYFLHTAPGDVLMYSNLIHNLPGDQPCYAFQSLGLHDAKAAHSSIEAMCSHYVKLLVEFQPEGPYMLCGWCFGGTLAYEMALQLKAQGREVSLLAVLDVWTHTPAKWSLRIRYYLQAVRLFSVMPWERKKSYVVERLRNRLSKTMQPENIRETLQVEVKHGALKNRDDVYRRNLQATEVYRSRFYPGKVYFFRPDWLDPEFLPDLLLGWGLISADQEAFLIPGGHRTMLTEPNVQILADRLTKCIEAAQKKS